MVKPCAFKVTIYLDEAIRAHPNSSYVIWNTLIGNDIAVISELPKAATILATSSNPNCQVILDTCPFVTASLVEAVVDDEVKVPQPIRLAVTKRQAR